jgi:hypothetical protein
MEKTDAEMSIAIENLRVMLDTEDIDLIIELLQQNNWDETEAASAYMARQVPDDQQPLIDNGGVRAPMQQRTERLIDEQPDPFAILSGLNPQVMRQ